MYNSECASKIGGLIEEFFKIAKSRFDENFNIAIHEVDMEYKDITKEYSRATIFTVEKKDDGKRCMIVTYIAIKGLREQVKKILDEEFLPYIELYHKHILHEYAEAFLFHSEHLNYPHVQTAHLDSEREDICNRFARAILKLVS